MSCIVVLCIKRNVYFHQNAINKIDKVSITLKGDASSKYTKDNSTVYKKNLKTARSFVDSTNYADNPKCEPSESENKRGEESGGATHLYPPLPTSKIVCISYRTPFCSLFHSYTKSLSSVLFVLPPLIIMLTEQRSKSLIYAHFPISRCFFLLLYLLSFYMLITPNSIIFSKKPNARRMATFIFRVRQLLIVAVLCTSVYFLITTLKAGSQDPTFRSRAERYENFDDGVSVLYRIAQKVLLYFRCQ